MKMIPDLVVARLRGPALLCVRFLRNLGADFVAHGCQKSAAALTYLSLFALVPLMTVVYSVFSLIPAFDGVADQLRNLLFTHLVPQSGQELQSYIAEFSSQARSLTGVGVAMLVVTAYWMLSNIERTFNAIWGVQRPRKGIASFLLYWAVLSIGPLLLGAGFAISTYLLSLKLVFNNHDLGVSSLVFEFLPFVLGSAAFTLLFAAVPNCRVPLRHAVIGGVVTALMFQLLKEFFGAVVARSSFQLVYGAFAAVPLFLLWVNLVWTVILAGAILVRTLAERSYRVEEEKFSDMHAALKCLELLHQRSRTGRSVSDADCFRLGIGVVHWQRLRGLLEKARWLMVTGSGHYVLSRDLRSVTLWDLARVVGARLADLEAPVAAKTTRTPWYQLYAQHRTQLLQGARDAFDLSLETLFISTQTGQEPEIRSKG
ncbi:MAG: YihY family inner membrane protein [Cellvibrionaceae bacterium]|nr:YihY family inner membrane protein [Cellvibrionaceae bacterium]